MTKAGFVVCDGNGTPLTDKRTLNIYKIVFTLSEIDAKNAFLKV